ncbi:hypothetical protein M0L11_RS16365 [Providencia rettgeri]|nr:hypothetical protein [Providencia rettgeri]
MNGLGVVMFACEIRLVEISNRYARIEVDSSNMSTCFYLLILLSLFFATIITYHYVTLVTYGLPVSKMKSPPYMAELHPLKSPLIGGSLFSFGDPANAEYHKGDC